MLSTVVLQLTGGALSGRQLTFDAHDTLLFGRHSTCHIRLAGDGYVSRHQFVMEIQPPHASLRDLGSLNGTDVNGVRYGGRGLGETPEQAAMRRYPDVPLKDGDRITVGGTIIVVHAEQIVEAILVEYCSACGAELLSEKSSRPMPAEIVNRPIPSLFPTELLCSSCCNVASSQDDPAAALLRRVQAVGDAVSQFKVAGYELLDKLGQGGMGVVFRAKRLTDGVMVAVKVMLAQSSVEPALRMRFLREIESLLTLKHRWILDLLDHGSQGGAFYFAMEYCPGGSTHALLKRLGGKLPPEIVLPIMLQTLHGLAYAHEQGFVHRDLKPDNLLLQRSPLTPSSTSLTASSPSPTRGEGSSCWCARVADFGLAKSFEQAGLSGMTATGQRGGTLYFMPREQLSRYRHAVPANDVWSAAATFYYLLTGQLTRDFERCGDPVRAVMDCDAVPIRRRDPWVPAPLAEVLDRALKDDPAERYSSAREMLEALLAAGGLKSVPEQFVCAALA